MMFFTSVDCLWLRTNMTKNRLPLTKLFKMPVNFGDATPVIKKYCQGEIMDRT